MKLFKNKEDIVYGFHAADVALNDKGGKCGAMSEGQKMVEQSGRSMVEMLGVLAIIGVLSVAGISGYRMAMNRYQANKLLEEFNVVAMEASARIMSSKRSVPDDRYPTCLHTTASFDDLSFEVKDGAQINTGLDGWHHGFNIRIYKDEFKNSEVLRIFLENLKGPFYVYFFSSAVLEDSVPVSSNTIKEMLDLYKYGSDGGFISFLWSDTLGEEIRCY